MEKHDNEIRRAGVIAEGWKKELAGTAAFFLSLKKDSINVEKKALTALEKEIAQLPRLDEKARRGAERSIAGEIERIDEVLAKCEQAGQSRFEEHTDWALKEPRNGIRRIATQLKLGKPGDEAYEAVAKAHGHQLEAIAKLVGKVDAAWTKDCRFAVTNQRERLQAVAKIFQNGRKQAAAYQDYKVKQAAEFRRICTGIAKSVGVKEKAARKELDEIKRKKEDALSGKTTDAKKKFQQYENRRDQCADSYESIKKNFARIKKSIPKGFWKDKGEVEMAIVADRTSALRAVHGARATYTALIEAYKRFKLV